MSINKRLKFNKLAWCLPVTMMVLSACSDSADSDKSNSEANTDNDGVINSIDVFPTDPNESLDTDQDGTGNNADTDDDNDQYTDQHL